MSPGAAWGNRTRPNASIVTETWAAPPSPHAAATLTSAVLLCFSQHHDRRERKARATAIGGLTHGAPVAGLQLVFVLGSVPHERQPFYSCQSAARDRRTVRRADRQGEGGWQSKPGGGRGVGKKKKEKEGQNRRMWLTFGHSGRGRHEQKKAELLDTQLNHWQCCNTDGWSDLWLVVTLNCKVISQIGKNIQKIWLC